MAIWAFIMGLAFIGVCTGMEIDRNSSQSLWERSGHFEGDILLTQRQERNGIEGNRLRWPHRTLPFTFGPHFDQVQKRKILQSIKRFNAKTCIKVREYIPGVDTHYIEFRNDEPGCFSFIGRLPADEQPQPIYLEDGCLNDAGVHHEILHALGFVHQQSAIERDKYVTIIWKNIIPGMKYNFLKYKTKNFGVPYDYSSLMHYGERAFSKNGRKTIVPKNPHAHIGQRVGMTRKDRKKLARMYKCV